MDFIHTLAIESWTMYSVGMALVICRLISRRLKLGTWKLQIEDWLMIFAAANFTGVIVSVNEVAVNGSNYMDPEVAASLTPEQKDAAIYGSKMTLVLEVFTLTCIWTIKACLLLLYYRLADTFRNQQRAVLFISGYCVIGYVLVMGLCLGYWCAPIYEYWAVPVNISQCATYYHHMIFATAWNISSDLMLLGIPIPIVFKTKLPLKRKLLLCCVLGLGVLNIIVAVLNRYFNFNNPNDLGYVYFYVAEVATAVYVGNIPLCWPLFQRLFHMHSWTRSASKTNQSDNPNRPRTTIGSGRFSRNKKSAQSSLWSTTVGNTVWDRMDAIEEQSHSKESICRGNGSEDQTSSVELTPHWHREANVTEIHGGRGAASDGAESVSSAEKEKGTHSGRVNIIKTVEISRDLDSKERLRGPR